jgi:hypothetical protein
MNVSSSLNSDFNVDTPTPGKNWLDLNDSERILLINSSITQLNKSNKIKCTRALSSGEVYLSILESIPVTERLDFFLDLEFELKKIIDDALFLSCEPLGDKSSLRNLRGIQVKTIKDN